MEFDNALFLRATVDELLRRRAYVDYEELLRREINAQVDEFVNNALAVRAFVAPGSAKANSRTSSFGVSNQQPVVQQHAQPSFVFPSHPTSIAFPTQSSISFPRISSSVVLPLSQPTPAPVAPQQQTQQQTQQQQQQQQDQPSPVQVQPAERAAAAGGGNLKDALATINGQVAAAASSVSAALASSTASSDKDGGDDKKKHGLSPGAIAGIVACVVLLLLLIITIVVYLHRRGDDDDDESVAPQDEGDYEKGPDQGNMQEIPLDHNGPDYGAAAHQQYGEPAYPVQQQQQQPYSAYDNAPYHGGYPGPQHGVPEPGYLHTAPPQLPDPFQDPRHQGSPFDHPADHYAVPQPPQTGAYAGQNMAAAGPSGYGNSPYAQDVPHSPTSSRSSSFSSAPSSPHSPDSPHHLHHQKSRKLLKVVNA
ncbi:hypothetical protein QCA50_000166 [Cerrena zonata]|uniref:Uncharacterized protein n=1 Tax=Cerrena zonata TaxID=2478898 RepID=A0AAW0GZE8_9APHY